MEILEGGSLEQKVMEKVGCVDFSATPWDSVSPDVHQRQINYKFDKNISRYGGEVTSTQQRSPLHDKDGWLIEEVMTLQGVLLGDYFTVSELHHEKAFYNIFSSDIWLLTSCSASFEVPD